MYHHFFVFRRFPIPELLRKCLDFVNVTAPRDKKAFKELVLKILSTKSKYLQRSMREACSTEGKRECRVLRSTLWSGNPTQRFHLCVPQPRLCPSVSYSNPYPLKLRRMQRPGESPRALRWLARSQRPVSVWRSAQKIMVFYEKLPKNREIYWFPTSAGRRYIGNL